MDHIDISPINRPVNASMRPPGSKSLTNRALIIAAMAEGHSVLHGVLDSDDTIVMRAALETMGVSVEYHAESKSAVVHGSGGRLNGAAKIEVGNSGTSIRFLTAMLGFAGGEFTLDGIERMRQRPIGPLVDALCGLGAHVVAESTGGCPPVKISSGRIIGGQVQLSGDLSSQYLSGLLMAAPLADHDVVLEIKGELVSRPYVEMTCRVMDSFGVKVHREPDGHRFLIEAGQGYQGREYHIEPDASAASYFWATAAILGGTATVTGLNEDSLQGDVEFVRCLEKMGCEVEFGADSISVSGKAKHGANLDMADVSDTVQTLTSVALFVDGPTTITNIAHNRVKETDRIGNLAIELRKFGVRVDERPDGMTIHPGQLNGATIETYDDHRMAMSLALVGLRQPGVRILEPACVSKTFPNYFDELKKFVGY